MGRITDFHGGGSGRTDLWSVALSVTRHHLLHGVGIGNFSVVEPGYAATNINLGRPDLVVDIAQVVHNTYLHVLAELGIIGFLLFIGMIGGSFLSARRAIRRFASSGDREMEMFARGLVIGAIGMLTAYAFLSAQYEKQLFLIVGVLAGLSSLSGRVMAPASDEAELR